MGSGANSFGQLAVVDPTFQIDGPWNGHFQLNGYCVRCGMDAEQWIRLTMPLALDEARAFQGPQSNKSLVREQERLLLPIKIVSGPALVGELPCDEDLPSTFEMLRAAFSCGVDILESRSHEISASDHADPDPDALARFKSTLEQSQFHWGEHNGLLSTNTKNGKVVATLHTESVVLRASIAYLGRASHASFDALEHFVLSMNVRFRLVRGAFVADKLVGEVALPTAVLKPSLVDHAVRSISASLQTKRACTALIDEQVAEQYLDLHTHRKDQYADTHH